MCEDTQSRIVSKSLSTCNDCPSISLRAVFTAGSSGVTYSFASSLVSGQGAIELGVVAGDGDGDGDGVVDWAVLPQLLSVGMSSRAAATIIVKTTLLRIVALISLNHI